MAVHACENDTMTSADQELFACAAPGGFDAAQYRQDFPILSTLAHGKPLAYLDSAASAQKPRQVLDAMQRFYEREYANIHRGVYDLSQRATARYEGAREIVRRFLHAPRAEDIVFTGGTTAAVNLVANGWGASALKEGDEVVLTQLEHHANIVPWQLLRERVGIVLRVVPITENGDVRAEDVVAAITPRTRLVAVAHVSNALGTVLPVETIIRAAHTAGAYVLLDGAQAVSHLPVDVQALDVDFYAFSGHKLYGPTGIGVLYARRALLESMAPWQGGGDMIESVSFERTTFREPPHRFEAGTPPIAEAVGLAAAIEYVSTIGLDRIARHEAAILAAATEQLRTVRGLHLVGTAPHKAGIVSFTMDGAHPHDIGTVLDFEGVAIRAGHHCAQPLMDALGLPATARASFGLYTTMDDIAALVRAVRKVAEMFA